jgi:transposase
MVKQIMFDKIKTLQRQGYSISEISTRLSISRKTISKYYKMSEPEYKNYLKSILEKEKSFDKYKKHIIEVYKINNFKKLNMTAVFDYLEEKFGELLYSEKTLRNYINYLLRSNQLRLNNSIRLYTKVPELPYGKQMQLDFGVDKTKNGLKLYIFAAVLSSSRFKYISFQDKPFKTIDVILNILDAFDFFQGNVEELVIDQDSTMVVSENHGDIIYTKKFRYFLDEMGLKMYVCRKSDPESKGKIENVIKFVKYNFLQPRCFNDLQEAKDRLKRWLYRRGNGKINQATKRIPAEEIIQERKHLKPLVNSIFRKDTLIGREQRNVNEHSFVSINASLYSVPTKYRNKIVEIYQTKTNVYIFDVVTGKEICNHYLSLIPGERVIDREHFRDKEKSSKELKEKVIELFPLNNWKIFIQNNFKELPRYVRDQCLDAMKYFSCNEVDSGILDKALEYCLENKTHTISNLNDTYKYFSLYGEARKITEIPFEYLKNNVERVNIQNRDIRFYKSFLTEAVNESL